MKKSLVSATLVGSAMVAVAQPTIQANQFDYMAAPAFTYKYQTGQTAVGAGPSGANVTWNFTSLGPGSNLDYTTAACPGDADCGTFPGANQVLKMSTLAKLYYEKTGSGFEQIGEKASGTFVYSDPMKYMQFPMTYNQTYNDTYASSNGADTKNGTVTSTIDGYGTLQTPTGTYTNVLRQKIVENTTVTTGGTSVNMTFTHYYWIKAGMNHYIMSIVSTEITNAPVPVPATYAVGYTTATSGGVSIDEQEALAAAIDIYPNPAVQELHIGSNSLRIEQVELWNVLGQKVLSKISGKESKVTLSLNNAGLGSGLYLVKIGTDKGSVTRQVVIR